MSRQLRLLEVRGDPDVVERDERHQRLARLHDLARLRRVFRLTMPRDRRLDGRVLQVQLGLRERRLAPAATCASADAARACVAATCCGPVCAVRSSACACCSPARACTSWLSATRMPASASATCDRAESTAACCASAAATAASNCCCETSSFASRPRSRSTSRAALAAFASASRSRACAVDEPRLRRLDLLLGCRRSPLCACSTPPRAVRHVARRGRRRDRHVALRGDARPLRRRRARRAPCRRAT